MLPRRQTLLFGTGRLAGEEAAFARPTLLAARQLTLRGRFVLDLAPLALAKGDQVRVTLEAVDYRGDGPGASAQSEPIVFQVTDESGILAGLVEADERLRRGRLAGSGAVVDLLLGDDLLSRRGVHPGLHAKIRWAGRA